jgi:hypothetical protein
MQPSSMTDYARLIRMPAYIVLAVVLIAYVSDFILTVIPFRLDVAQWRFGAIGTLSNAASAPLLILLLIFAVAAFAGDRRVLGIVGVLGAFTTLLLLVSAVDFTLDTLQMRTRLAPGQSARFAAASGQSLMKLGLQAIASVALARGAWRVLRASRHRAPQAASAATGRLVGTLGAARPVAEKSRES